MVQQVYEILVQFFQGIQKHLKQYIHIQIYTDHHPYMQSECIKKRKEINKYRQRCGQTGMLLLHRCECKMGQPLRKKIWQFLQNLKNKITISSSNLRFWIYLLKRLKQGLEQTFVLPCSQLYYTPQPKGRTTLSVHLDGQTKCVSTM